MNTINNGIPFVPENTIDPAAGLNISLNTIDALLQVLVQTVGANTPPTGIEGQRHIVGTAPTGVWAGQANKLARFLDGVWSFFDARHVLNAADGFWYVRSGSAWVSSPLPANVAALAGLAGAADRLPYFTGEGALSLTTLTALARTLLDDTTQGQMQSTLGLGSAATRTALGTTGSLYSRDSILGTVSQSGGVPTGAIIERGSNANGEYVKFADGTQICVGVTNTQSCSAAFSTLFYNPTVCSGTYPAIFSVSPTEVLAIAKRADGLGSVRLTGSQVATGSTTATPGYRGVSETSGQTVSFSYTAVGRWF